MEVQAIGKAAFTVYITQNELEARSLDPRNITPAQAQDLVKTVVDCPPLGAVSLELYPGRHELLIFVKRSFGEPAFYRFGKLETLLSALEGAVSEPPSSLYLLDGRYYLVVWNFEGQASLGFSEFAEPLERPTAYLLHLREHGRTICEADAVRRLREAFFPAKS